VRERAKRTRTRTKRIRRGLDQTMNAKRREKVVKVRQKTNNEKLDKTINLFGGEAREDERNRWQQLLVE
jgi:hypothetical protein